MLKAEGLTRRYGDFVAARDVSFTIESGEVVGLLGHNGAGKTTVMKMLTGYLEPSSGSVTVDGINLSTAPLAVQSRLGYLPESLPLYPEMSVAEYLAHAARMRGLRPEDCVGWAVQETQLQDKITDRVDTLSRGYKQRLGVAQAILHQPDILVLDEPTNGLDPNQIQQMRELILKLAEQATVLLSTHIMQEVNAICSRTLMMRGGTLVMDKRLDELTEADTLKVRCGDLVEASVLSSVPGVVAAQQQGNGEWLLRIDAKLDDVADRVAKALVECSIAVYELAPQVKDLESVFRQVNEEQDEEQENTHAA